MNTLWLLKGIPDFENIGPLLLRAFESHPQASLFVVLDSHESAENPVLGRLVTRLNEILRFEVVNISNGSINDLDLFLQAKSIETIIFEWGAGYPTSISTHLKWICSNKKKSFRSRLIKAGRKRKVRLICLPHAVSMHKSWSIKPVKPLRKLVNTLTGSRTIEDYSDRNVFDQLLFYNQVQRSNYEKFFNLSSAKLGLVSLYKYDRNWMDVFHSKGRISDENIVFSIPKLHNNINIGLLVETLETLEKFCWEQKKTAICAFHPRVEINTLPKVILEAIQSPIFETCTQPFSQIIHRTSVLLDAGSSILLDGLYHRFPVAYLAYLDGNEIIEILDDNFYEVREVLELPSFLMVSQCASPFKVPGAFIDGERYSAEQVVFGF